MAKKQKKDQKPVASVAPAGTINVDGKPMTIPKYRDVLLEKLRVATDKKDTVEAKRLRGMLRTKCKHFGGLRQRTYVDKAAGSKKVEVTKK